MSRKNKAKTYEGKRCHHCGSKVRYASNKQCVSCVAVRGKQRTERIYSKRKYNQSASLSKLKKKHTFSVRMNKEPYEKLVKEAEKNKRSINAQMELIVEKYFDL